MDDFHPSRLQHLHQSVAVVLIVLPYVPLLLHDGKVVVVVTLISPSLLVPQQSGHSDNPEELPLSEVNLRDAVFVGSAVLYVMSVFVVQGAALGPNRSNDMSTLCNLQN